MNFGDWKRLVDFGASDRIFNVAQKGCYCRKCDRVTECKVGVASYLYCEVCGAPFETMDVYGELGSKREAGVRNAVVLICYGNLELTKRAVRSVVVQDIPVDLYVVDNGSKDGTWEWLGSIPHRYISHAGDTFLHPRRYEENRPPICVGNRMMEELFAKGYDHILGVPNDIILPANLYRLMLEWPRGIVTASMTQDLNFPRFETATPVSEHTPLCVVLVRKWAWQAIVSLSGYFWDEGFCHYASDCDLAIRIGACGIRGIQLDVQYYHEISATLKRAEPEYRRSMEVQADKDRAYFIQKWGFPVSDPYYGQFVSDLNNQGIPKSGTVK